MIAFNPRQLALLQPAAAPPAYVIAAHTAARLAPIPKRVYSKI